MLSERVSSVLQKLSTLLNYFRREPIHTVHVSSLRPLTTRSAPDGSERSVEALQTEISVLCAERQTLRAAGAGEDELERNRLEIARLQWELSHALIGRYSRTAAA